VLEAPTSSIFWVKDGTVMTPPLSDHILASITRRVVLDQAGAHERECTLDDLASADEAFLASTVREVQPIAAIEDRAFDMVGPITQRIAEEVTVRIESELDAA
jgi:branched-chain amino acid aminotransferase